MSNEKMILVLLSLMLIVQVMAFAREWLTLKGRFRQLEVSAEMTRKNLEIALGQADELRDTNEKLASQVIRDTKLSDTAFAITADGVKALPADWVSRCFPEVKS